MTLAVCLASIVGGCIDGGTGDVTTTHAGADGADHGVVTWIADGDTVEVETAGVVTEVRLVSVNTPDQGECYVEEARDHLIETLRDEPVRVEPMGEDQFGRTLAHLFEGDRHVNLELIEMGLALAGTPERADPYGTLLLQAENAAYDAGAGLWAEDACGSDRPRPRAIIEPERSKVDPTGPDDARLDGEFIAILNDGSELLDLSGWILRDESSRHRFTFPPDTMLEAGERVMVTSSDGGWDPGDAPVWNNGGDMALLQLPDGTVVSRWRY